MSTIRPAYSDGIGSSRMLPASTTQSILCFVSNASNSRGEVAFADFGCQSEVA